MFTSRKIALIIGLILFTTGFVLAQRFDGGGFRRGYPDRSTFPVWENTPGYEDDVFTFARIKYIPHYRRGWDGDYPEADWNISYRLQELTSLKVNPHPVALELTDPDLINYPFYLPHSASLCRFLRYRGASPAETPSQRRFPHGRRVLGIGAMGSFLYPA